MATLTALLDACVLYPQTLRDLLLNLARTDLFRARWTDLINDEWTRKLLEKNPGKADTSRRTRQPPGARRAWTCGERAVIALCRGFDRPSVGQREPL